MDTRKVTKAKVALEDIFYNGNLKRYKMTPSEAHEAWDAMVGILNDGETRTISERVKDFYVKYGFSVHEEGIGWVIKLK